MNDVVNPGNAQGSRGREPARPDGRQPNTPDGRGVYARWKLEVRHPRGGKKIALDLSLGSLSLMLRAVPARSTWECDRGAWDPSKRICAGQRRCEPRRK